MRGLLSQKGSALLWAAEFRSRCLPSAQRACPRSGHLRINLKLGAKLADATKTPAVRGWRGLGTAGSRQWSSRRNSRRPGQRQ